VLTPAEKHLVTVADSITGRRLIKDVRQELIEKARYLLEAIITDILALKVLSLHTDISSRTGERVIVLTLEKAPRFRSE
jgi:uncharacterized protein YbcI